MTVKTKIKRIAAVAAAVLAAACLLWLAQLLLIPKYMDESGREGALAAEFYQSSLDHDVLFVGDCEVFETFVPAVLWDETGLSSFVRGGPQQMIWQSYYLIEDALRYETPEAVVFNVYSMKYGYAQKNDSKREGYNRMSIDGMRWSRSKIDCIRASMTDEESFASYVFPILRFHSRWKELDPDDLRYMFSRDKVSLDGYLYNDGVQPMSGDAGEITPLFDYTLPAECFEYLDKIRALCDDNGVKLILVKAPTDSWNYHWYGEWDVQIRDYAEKYGLNYLNLIGKTGEIGIDWTTDTYDAGIHLNASGAEKTTRYFSKYLTETCGIAPTGNENAGYWNAQYEIFCQKGEN